MLIIASLLIIIYTINAFNIANITYLYSNKLTEMSISKKTHMPLYILSETDYRMVLEWSPYTYDKKRYIFFKKPGDLINAINERDDKQIQVAIDSQYTREKSNEINTELLKKYNPVSETTTFTGDNTGFNVFEFDLK